MAFIDVLKCDRHDLLVWKWEAPGGGSRQEELRLGTQLIVNHSQQAVFVRDGKIADIFDPGKYTLSTKNLPILSGIVGLAFGGQSPFKAEVFFFNKTVAMNIKFGLVPFNMIEPNFKIPIPITSRGSFAIKVDNVKAFISQIIGTIPSFEAEKLKDYFRGVITEQVKTAIFRVAKEQSLSPLELESIVLEVSDAVKGIISNAFSNYGIHLELFNIEGVSIIDDDQRVKKIVEDYQQMMAEDIQERMRLKRRAENLEVYKVERTFDTTEAAATNMGKGGDGVVGTMMGLGLVAPLGNTISGMMQNMAPNVQPAPPQPSSEQPQKESKEDIIKLLKELGELKNAGILTEDEFAEKKKALLDRI